MKSFEGKVAVVTGGNRGIGLASAKRLKDEGAQVAIAGRTPKTLDEAAKMLGDGALAIQADVSRLEEIENFFSLVKGKLGKIDILFVNAGMGGLTPLAETSEPIYDELFSTNLKGAPITRFKKLSPI